MITKETTDTSKLIEGLDAVRDIVASTIGPFGCNVSMAGGHERLTFDDGYKSILKYVPTDPMVREGVFRVRDAAKSQVDEVGDGTSTTTLLMVALYKAAMELVNKGMPRQKVVEAFTEYARQTENFLEGISMATMVDGATNRDLVKAVATIAMHGNKESGDMVGGLVSDMGPYGMVTVEKSPSGVLEVERSVGYAWREGVPDRVFFNHNGACQLGESLVVLVNQNDVDQIQTTFWDKILNHIWPKATAEAGKQLGLVLICNGAAGSVMSTFAKATNPKTGERMPMLILKTPNLGKVDSALTLADIAEVTGATVFDMRRGTLMDGVSPIDVGRIAGVRSTTESTTLALMPDIDGKVMEQVIADAAKWIETSSSSDTLKEERQLRLAALSGATGVIKVPVVTETSLSEIREEIEDGYRAAMSALTDGVLPGGGRALASAASHLLSGDSDEATRAFSVAILSPFQAITDSASVVISSDDAARMSMNAWMAVDLSTGKVGHAAELGLLDSKKVVLAALRNAMSVAMPMAKTKFWLVNQE